jgi:Ca2+-binding RTX toxin-like protein
VNGVPADHVAWSEAINQSGLTGLGLNSLAETGVSTLQSQASTSAGMYALLKLNPFTITGANYSHLNRNGELDAENYSTNYLEDRAAFLYQSMHENTEPIQYDQEGSGIRVNPPSDIHVPARYWFGSEGSDDLYGHPGANREDHLYGMAGDDTLNGYAGNDILEGGAGSDTMHGGLGEDKFIIHGTDPDPAAYDTFNGGANTDTIQGGDLDDTIRVHEFEGDNTVEIIDGGGGDENILAGTDQGDTIDLTGTELRNIQKIELEGGSDTIRLSYESLENLSGGVTTDGGDGKDTIEGSSEDDLLDLSNADIINIESVDLGQGDDFVYVSESAGGPGDGISELM